MLTIFTYSPEKGFLQTQDASQLADLIDDERRATWVDLAQPTPAEIDILKTVFQFHPLAIDDCLTGDGHHQPKIDNYGDYVFLICHEMLAPNGSENFKTEELAFFLSKNYLVTHHRSPLRSIRDIRALVERTPKPLVRGADFLLSTILDQSVDLFNPVLDFLDHRIDRLEDHLLKEVRDNPLKDIFKLKKNVSLLHRLANYQTEAIISLIEDGHYEEFLPTAQPYVSNVRDHLIRIADLLHSYQDAFSGLTEAHLMNVSNRVNGIMKFLTLFASLMLPMTVVTGVYGMNFKYMPELEWKYGYPFALGLMAAISGGLLIFFRRKKWI